MTIIVRALSVTLVAEFVFAPAPDGIAAFGLFGSLATALLVVDLLR